MSTPKHDVVEAILERFGAEGSKFIETYDLDMLHDTIYDLIENGKRDGYFPEDVETDILMTVVFAAVICFECTKDMFKIQEEE